MIETIAKVVFVLFFGPPVLMMVVYSCVLSVGAVASVFVGKPRVE